MRWLAAYKSLLTVPLMATAMPALAQMPSTSVPVVFPASVPQGSMAIGRVPPGSEARYGGRQLRISDCGTAVFGMGRDEKARCRRP